MNGEQACYKLFVVEPIQLTKRWEKKGKSYKSLPSSWVIGDCNNHMNGVDLLDFFLTSLYFKMSHKIVD